RMVPGVRRIVTRRAGSLHKGHVEVVIDPGDAGDGDRQRVEQGLSTSDRRPRGVPAAAREALPRRVLCEDDGIERRVLRVAAGACRVAAERIVHAEDEWLQRELLWATERPGRVQLARRPVEDLRGVKRGLVRDDLLSG